MIFVAEIRFFNSSLWYLFGFFFFSRLSRTSRWESVDQLENPTSHSFALHGLLSTSIPHLFVSPIFPHHPRLATTLTSFQLSSGHGLHHFCVISLSQHVCVKTPLATVALSFSPRYTHSTTTTTPPCTTKKKRERERERKRKRVRRSEFLGFPSNLKRKIIFPITKNPKPDFKNKYQQYLSVPATFKTLSSGHSLWNVGLMIIFAFVGF